jgi:hypothetical protein
LEICPTSTAKRPEFDYKLSCYWRIAERCGWLDGGSASCVPDPSRRPQPPLGAYLRPAVCCLAAGRAVPAGRG